MRDHRKLRAFQVADALVEKVYLLTMQFPRSELFGFTAQMRRAVVSTASNIVEGSSRRSQSEYVRFLEISLGSAKELAYHLELAERLGFLRTGETFQASNACSELIRLLAGLVRAFDARSSARDLPCSLKPVALIYLIDASVYVFRAYYSMPPDMFDRDGNPAHALFGFARFIGDLLERARPQHIAVAFDERLTGSFRNRLYPAYKANRDPAPPGLELQVGRCREFCALVGVAEFGSGEYEADDIIGTLVCRMRREGLRSTLVTRDKDLAQLIREGDVYWDYTSGVRFRYHEIEGRFGVAPERFADYLALTGDAVDNIRGVPGIGPKTAGVLMREFVSLEELYDNLELVPKLNLRRAGELPAILREHRPAAFLARQLTSIACDLPIAVETASLRPRRPDVAALTRFYDRHNFGPTLRRQTDRLVELAA